MEQIKRFQMKKVILLFSSVLATVFFINVTSCNNQSDKDISTLTSGMPDPLKLNYGQIKRAWNSINAGDIDYLTFYTNYDRRTGAFRVDMQAFKKDYKKIGSSKELDKRNNNPVNLPPFLHVESNLLHDTSFKKLDIIDASGKLKKFDSIVLRPNQWQDPKSGYWYLNYIVKVYPEMMTTAALIETLPCPPCYNCRPIPPDCEVIIITDTTGNNTDTTMRN